MTLTYPMLDRPLAFTEECVNSLVIENPGEMRYAVEELRSQIGGETGRFVLGIDNEPVELSRIAVLVSDPFSLELDSKKLLTKLLQEAVRMAREKEDRVRQLLGEINELAAEICMELDYEVRFSELEEPDGLLRLLELRPDRESLSLPERLLEFMRLQRAFLGKRLFIIYGLKAILLREEMESLIRSVRYEKLDVLLLDPFQRGAPVEGEMLTIIDEDLCVLR